MRGYNSNRENLIATIREVKADFVLLQETKCKGRNNIKISGFTTFERNINRTPNSIAHGGVAILAKPFLQPKRIQLNTRLQAIAVKIHLFRPITLCSIYVQESDRVTRNDLQNVIDQLGQDYVIGGDFNAHSPMWDHSNFNTLGRALEEIFNENDLILLYDGTPTYLNKRSRQWSTLDLTFASSSLSHLPLLWTPLLDLGNSDHLPIHITLHQWDHHPTPFVQRFLENDADWDEYKRKSATIDIQVEDPILALQELKEKIRALADKCIPKTSIKVHRRTVPWWNKEAEEAVKDRKRALRCFKRNPTTENLIRLNRATHKSKKTIEASKRESRLRLCESISPQTPIANIFRDIKRLQGTKTGGRARILHVGDRTITDPQLMAEAYANHFASASSSSNYNDSFQTMAQHNTFDPRSITEGQHEFNKPFSYFELERALAKCRSKTPGPDKISYQMIKNLDVNVKSVLLEIYNKIWTERLYPEEWKQAIVLPLPKPGKDPSQLDNHRPISFTCCDAKTMERMAMHRFNYIMENAGHYDKDQNGFRRNRSSIDNVVVLKKLVTEALHNQEHCYAIFFDLRKAYDRIWRPLVMKQLQKYDVDGNMAHFFWNFLKERSIRVNYHGFQSSSYLLENGVPQGSVAAVHCFLAAINDFESDLRRKFHERFPALRLVCLSYADDKASLVFGPKSTGIGAATQFVMDFTLEWMESNGFELALEKTQLIHFCGKKTCAKPPFNMRDTRIRVDRTADFLGTVIDTTFCWRQNTLRLKAKCLPALNALRMLSGPRIGGNQTIMLRLNEAIIASRLLYGSEVYCNVKPSNLILLERTYHAGIRLALGAFRTSPIISLIYESGMLSFTHQMTRKNLFYCARIKASGHLDGYNILNGHRDGQISKAFADFLRENNLQDAKIQPTQYPPPPWSYVSPTIDCTLARRPRAERPPIILRAEAERRLEIYDDCDKIFTDGSLMNDKAAFAVVGPRRVIAHRTYGIKGVYEEEINAIRTAVEMVRQENEKKWLIVSDSLSAITALGTYDKRHPTINAIQNIITNNNLEVTFMYVPAHVGIHGNEMADFEAKKATQMDEPSHPWITVNTCKAWIKSHVNTLRQQAWNEVPAENKLKSHKQDLSIERRYLLGKRHEDTVITRLRIGHTRLTHTYLMTRDDPPMCETCQEQVTVNHILTKCAKYSSERRTNMLGATMKEVMKEDVESARKVIKFMKDINLYSEI